MNIFLLILFAPLVLCLGVFALVTSCLIVLAIFTFPLALIFEVVGLQKAADGLLWWLE